MEAVAALGLAVNVIQVLVWGQQTASFCLQLYRGEAIDPTLAETVQNLQNATNSLKNSIPQNPTSTEEQGLLEIAQKCGHIAEKLLKEVGPVSATRRKRDVFKAVYKPSSIEKLRRELTGCQAVLETQLLLDLR